MKNKVHNRCAIALVGGGLTTHMMAAVLRHCDYDFVWFSGLENTAQNHLDGRTTTLHQAGKIMLETLGIWDDLGKYAWPLTDIYVQIARQQAGKMSSNLAGDIGKWPLHFASADLPMGYVVTNQKLLSALLAFTKGVHRIPHKIAQLDLGSPCHLQDDNGQIWACDLVIACDGTNSLLREQAGLRAIQQKRGQSAIVTDIKTSHAIGTSAWQIFCAEGPLALMATQTHQASVVWTLSDEGAAEIAGLPDEEFNTALQSAFGNELGGVAVLSKRLVWPLRPIFVPKRTAEGFVLAGDAGHALHPLAGMGYNLALSDAAILLDCLQQAYKRGLSAGHVSVTQSYQQRRQVEILALTALTQSLNRLLSRKSSWLTLLSSTGMAVLGQTGLRRQIAKVAMGGVLSPAPLFSGKLRS